MTPSNVLLGMQLQWLKGFAGAVPMPGASFWGIGIAGDS